DARSSEFSLQAVDIRNGKPQAGNTEPRQYTTLLAFGQQSCTLAALFGVRRQSEAATALWIANLDFSNER
ncbi:MAG TPA: hypothetical protein VF333_08120, partial [Pyrinomonadaceae bacterium]